MRTTRTRTIATAAVLALGGLMLAACPPPRAIVSKNIWTSSEEITARPMAGPEWNHLVAAATGTWQTPTLASLTTYSDTDALAGALYATRLPANTAESDAMYAKTRAQIMGFITAPRYRVLELARNLTSVVIAADIVGLPASDDAAFRGFISSMRTVSTQQGHSCGCTTMRGTALSAPNNWGDHARAATAAIDLYLGDTADLAPIVETYKQYIGTAGATSNLVYTGTNWHAGVTPKVGILPYGTFLYGRDLDGAQPEEMRRAGEATANPPTFGVYPWEGLGAKVELAVMLDRARLVPFRSANNAILRAAEYLDSIIGDHPHGDDLWVPHVINRYNGSLIVTKPETSPGKGMGYQDWLQPDFPLMPWA